MKIMIYSAAALWLLGFGISSQAALLHHYEFESDVIDSAGSENGTLINGASISGGVLNLDGTDDYVQFSSKIVPTSGSYTVAFFATQSAAQSGFLEFISQGSSGGPGFYIGRNNSTLIRASDSWTNTGISFPADFEEHHYALVVDASASQSRFYLDGSLSATLSSAITTTVSGNDTRLGRQFDSFDEHFHGTLDDVRIYNSALSGSEVASLAAGIVPLPAPFLLLASAFGVLGVFRRKSQ